MKENKKTVHGIMDNHLPITKNQISGTGDTRLPGATYDHYALAEGNEAAKVKMSECEIEQSNFFFRPIFVHLSWLRGPWYVIY